MPPGGFLHPPLERMRGFDMRISTIITLSLVMARANVGYAFAEVSANEANKRKETILMGKLSLNGNHDS